MGLKIKKILLPYDDTESSVKAFKKILSIIENKNSKIILLTCIRDQSTFGFFKTKSDKEHMKKEKERAEKIHEETKRESEKFGIKVISKIVKSDLESKSIIDYAKKENVDVIIMSKSKLSTHAERVYYNSTVDAVFKNAPCMFLYLP